MDSTAKRILEVIRREQPIKARRIATVLGLERKVVNHYLYSDLRKLCVQNDAYEWSVISETVEKKIQNVKPVEEQLQFCQIIEQSDINIAEIDEEAVEEETSSFDEIAFSELGSNTSESWLPEDKSNMPTKTYRDDLERICDYYLQCISSERQDGIQVYAESKFDLNYRVVESLPRANNTYPEEVNNFLQKIMTSQSVAAYFGYPVLMKVNKKGTKILAPVFLWEVDKESGKVDFSQIPDINVELIKHYVTRGNEAVERELIHLQKELGLYDEEYLDSVDLLMKKIQHTRKWQWMETINTKKLSNESFSNLTKEGIYNKGIILSEKVSPFTKGLVNELKKLSEIPLKECKGTALYDWIKGVPENPQEEGHSDVLEILPLNAEQKKAVSKAISNDITVVTGPPGTGKSQVVISILINEVVNNKPVLFSSKNNKAVEVVIDRANGLTNTPFIAKLGGRAGDREFSETLGKLLTASESGQNSGRFQEQSDALIDALKERKAIEERIIAKIATRNEIDRLDKELEPLREKYDRYFKGGNVYDYSAEKRSWKEYVEAWSLTIKERQPFFQRLRWKSISPAREAAANQRYEEFKKQTAGINIELPVSCSDMSEQEIKRISDDLSNHFSVIDGINKLKKERENFRAGKSIEKLEREEIQIKNNYYEIAEKYWDLWLKQNNTALSSKDKQIVVEYLNGAEILKGQDENDTVPDEIKNLFRKVQKSIPKYINAQAVTLLSAKGRIPFEPACFDLLVIDEASQCDIASALPLLYRAKRVVVIGDLMQLPHVSTMARGRDMQLIHTSGIDDLSWLYSVSPLFKLATSRVGADGVVTLREHHRSHADIIDFSNNEFYGGDLVTATNYMKLNLPAKEEAGVSWIDVKGTTKRPPRGSATNEMEAKAICEKLIQYASVDYKGGIGVISPFREQANLIQKMMEANKDAFDKLRQRNGLEINTVHQFQGDEKDIILFSQTVANGATTGQLSFLRETGNLFNVAITRAKALLIAVGDKEYCSSCDIPFLQHFAKYVEEKTMEYKVASIDYDIETDGQYPKVPNMDQVSDWEILFYRELYRRGIRTYPQYPVDKYKLDLAIISGNEKLDIEVDGEAYHKTWDGELCYRDQLRNQRLFELGWDVRRFWVPDIRDNLDACIAEIVKWMDEHNIELQATS